MGRHGQTDRETKRKKMKNQFKTDEETENGGSKDPKQNFKQKHGIISISILAQGIYLR